MEEKIKELSEKIIRLLKEKKFQEVKEIVELLMISILQNLLR